MKLYHIIIAVIIVTTIMIGLTDFGGNGLLRDITDNYNGTDHVNISKFTTYDVRDEINTTIENVQQAGEQLDVSEPNSEQNWIQKFGSAVTQMGGSLTSAKSLITTATEELGVPGVIFWGIILSITVFVVVRTVGGWLLNR